jgi:hypothetical protein
LTPRRRAAERSFNTEGRSAVDFVGRLAANAREHTNVKYKTLGSLGVLCFSSCVLAARLRREVDGCHGAH